MQVLMSPIRTPNVHPVERWISLGSGLLLAGNGIRKGRSGWFQMAVGAMMIRRGLTGRCDVYRALGVRTAPSQATIPYELGIRARASVTIDKPRQEIYAFWRDLQNLPKFMKHLVSVRSTDDKRSHWVAEGLGGKNYEWDAEIINEEPNERVGWKSLPGSDVASAGSVTFKDAPGGRGTEVRVELQYNPPAGVLGAYAAKLFGREPEQEIQEDLRRLKQYLEGGETATTDGQPKGRSTPNKPSNMPEHVMEEAFT